MQLAGCRQGANDHRGSHTQMRETTKKHGLTSNGCRQNAKCREATAHPRSLQQASFRGEREQRQLLKDGSAQHRVTSHANQPHPRGLATVSCRCIVNIAVLSIMPCHWSDSPVQTTHLVPCGSCCAAPHPPVPQRSHSVHTLPPVVALSAAQATHATEGESTPPACLIRSL